MTDKQQSYLPFADFVRQYRSMSTGRANALVALRQITVTSEQWPVIKERLKANGFLKQLGSAEHVFRFWDQTYRKRGVPRLMGERPVGSAKPKPEGALSVKQESTLQLKEPIELTVDGSHFVVPLHAVAWIKKVDEEACIVALNTGEVIEADNTLGELRTQLRHILPLNPTTSNPRPLTNEH